MLHRHKSLSPFVICSIKWRSIIQSKYIFLLLLLALPYHARPIIFKWLEYILLLLLLLLWWSASTRHEYILLLYHILIMRWTLSKSYITTKGTLITIDFLLFSLWWWLEYIVIVCLILIYILLRYIRLSIVIRCNSNKLF